MMITISPILVLVFLVTIPISLLFTRYMTTKVRPLFRKRSEKLGELNGFAEEMISGQKTIKAYHREKVMIDRFDIKNEEAVTAYYKADYNGSMSVRRSTLSTTSRFRLSACSARFSTFRAG
jgi:ATP-binding cassette subfamily B protein